MLDVFVEMTTKTTEKIWIGVDLGATNAKAAVISDDGVVLSRRQIPLGDDLMPTPVVDKLVTCILSTLDDVRANVEDVAGIGIGSPGGIDAEKGVVIKSANLFPGCSNIPLCEMISSKCGGKSSYLVNDGDAAVLAERWVGVGRDVRNFVFLTLGSGIGSGVVVDGNLVANTEGGHMIIDPFGRPCPCGSRGCLEAYASANSVVRRTSEALRREDSPKDTALKASPTLTCKEIFSTSKSGDSFAANIVDETAKYLAIGCINYFRTLNTKMIVLSGGMVNDGDAFVRRVRYHVRDLNWNVLAINDCVICAKAG